MCTMHMHFFKQILEKKLSTTFQHVRYDERYLKRNLHFSCDHCLVLRGW